MTVGAAFTENFGDLLDTRFRLIYTKQLAERDQSSMIPMLYSMKTSTRNYEKISGVGALGDVGEFDGTLSYDAPTQLYDVTAEFPERAMGMKVVRKLADDDQFGIMDQRPYQMAVSVARTREKLGASIFNNAFTGTAGGDGVSLCNASHPYSSADATTVSNKGTSPLSPSSVEAARRIGHNAIFNDRGELMEVDYDLILCTVTNQEKAYEIIESKGKVDTADNNRNFQYGRYKLATWDRLSSPYPWFMIDSVLCKNFLIWWDRVKPEFNYDKDFDTYQAKWSTYFRCSPQFAGYQWIYGNLATS